MSGGEPIGCVEGTEKEEGPRSQDLALKFILRVILEDCSSTESYHAV